jgi:hypothetical protein
MSMRSAVCSVRSWFAVRWPLVAGAAAFACSAPDTRGELRNASGSTAGQVGSTAAGTGGAHAAGAGGATAGGGGALASGGASGNAGASGNLGLGGRAEAGAGGVPAGGTHSGGVSGGGASASAGSAGANAICQMVESEYLAALAKQLACKPGAASQCANKAAAAPGCECRVFIQPADPFAIEQLSNLANGWFDANCSMPSCPAKCSTAAAGTCQADSNSPLGGRCVTP